jgi:hypothetical protein
MTLLFISSLVSVFTAFVFDRPKIFPGVERNGPPKSPLPDYLFGNWEGEVKNPVLPPAMLELTINPNQYLAKFSTPNDYCKVRLEVLRQEGNSVRFREYPIEGDCGSIGQVTLSKVSDDSLYFFYEDNTGSPALTRSGALHKK